jgi:hypothetical protein
MSMLTPLGSGGRTRRSRRWPRVLAVVIALAILAVAGYAGWRWASQDEPTAPTTTSTSVICRTPSPKAPRTLPSPSDVTVTVANGTDRAGLAVDTADELAAVGFDVSDIGNTSRPVKAGVAIVHFESDDLAAAITVGSYVPGARLSEDKQVDAGTVTLWLGPEFDGVVSADDADPGSVVLPTSQPTCRTPGP